VGFNTISRILVVAEEEGCDLARISRQSVGAALKFKAEWGSQVFAFLPLNRNGSAAAALAKSGPQGVYQLEHALANKHPYEVGVAGLIRLFEEVETDLVLFGASEWGIDMAARTAAKLGTGLVHGLIDLERSPEGENVVAVFMGFEEQLICRAQFRGPKPLIATLKPDVFVPATETDSACPVETLSFSSGTGNTGISVIRSLPFQPHMPDLESAAVVVAGGQGIGGKEGFAMLEDLARLLGGAVGCTLPPAEQGWVDRELMIGSTGKTVQPKVYIGCGIHGDAYHTLGMDASENIVVINDDDKAPFFELATCGLLGDLHEIVPQLTKRITTEKGPS